MSNFKAGDLVRFIGISEHDVENGRVYKVINAGCGTCSLLDDVEEEYWVSLSDVEAVESCPNTKHSIKESNVSNLFLVGEKVRFIGEDEVDLVHGNIYPVLEVNTSDNTCALLDGNNDKYWVDWHNLEKVDGVEDSETKSYTFKISLQGGDIQSSHEVTLKLGADEEALSLFVDLLKTVQ